MSRLLLHLDVELTDEERQALELAHRSGQKAYGEMMRCRLSDAHAASAA